MVIDWAMIGGICAVLALLGGFCIWIMKKAGEPMLELGALKARIVVLEKQQAVSDQRHDATKEYLDDLAKRDERDHNDLKDAVKMLTRNIGRIDAKVDNLVNILLTNEHEKAQSSNSK